MVVHFLWIINQSGQLIAKLTFTQPSEIGELGIRPDLHLTISSVLFSTYGMSQQITPNANPVESGGMNLIELGEHNIHIYETPTLAKFVLVTDAKTTSCNPLFRELHSAYVEYAMKNPFHIVDSGVGQAIRIPAFTDAVRAIISRANDASPRR